MPTRLRDVIPGRDALTHREPDEPGPSTGDGPLGRVPTDLERALPGIVRRLTARYADLGAAVVDARVGSAVRASASFRVRDFQVILVERQADRELRQLRQRH